MNPTKPLNANGKPYLIWKQKRRSFYEFLKSPKAKPITVYVTKAKNGTLDKKESFLATVIADKSIKLSTKLAGFIKKVYVKDSQKVKKDQLLVEIDKNEILANINALKSAIKAQENDYLLAKKIFEGNIKLFKAGGLPKEKLEASKVALNAKKANWQNSLAKLEGLNNQLRYLTIKAPFDAIIDKVFLHEGDLAAAGRAIISLYNGKKKLIFSYAANSFSLKKGQKVFLKNIEIGYIGTIYKSAKNGLSMAEVILSKNINLPLDSSLTINVLLDKVNGCIVKSSAVIHKKSGNYVAIYKDGAFILKKVNLKVENNDFSVIKPCFKESIAIGNERVLSTLSAYKNFVIKGVNDAR
jgi:RND family efflux transporter MFP subunit